ncbi:MAG: hypothetical protein RSD57_13115 [Comamonas sp.]
MKRTCIWLGAALAAGVITPAGAVTAPPGSPTFYCDANRPAEADTVEGQLNTLRLTPTTPTLDNQGRWEYGTPFSSGTYTGEANVPASITDWVYFDLDDLNDDPVIGVTPETAVSAVGFQPQLPGATDNMVRYFRYRFNLASTVDPSTYQLSLSGMTADDAIVGTYLNGVRVDSGAASAVGGGATAELQWRSGANELAFAIYDSTATATHFTLGAATQAACNLLAVPPAAAKPVPGLTPAALGLLVAVLTGFGLIGRRRKS